MAELFSRVARCQTVGPLECGGQAAAFCASNTLYRSETCSWPNGFLALLVAKRLALWSAAAKPPLSCCEQVVSQRNMFMAELFSCVACRQTVSNAKAAAAPQHSKGRQSRRFLCCEQVVSQRNMFMASARKQFARRQTVSNAKAAAAPQHSKGYRLRSSSRISRSNSTSSGVAAGAGGASSCLRLNEFKSLIIAKMATATIRKSTIDCAKAPSLIWPIFHSSASLTLATLPMAA